MHTDADVNVTTLFQMPSLKWSRPLENSAPCAQNLWRHGRDTVDTTLAYSSADVDVTHRDAEKKRHGTRGFVQGRLAGTILPATTKTFGANDDAQPGGGKSIPGAHTMERQPTKIMKSKDVPQGVRRSYSFLFPQPMRACRHQEQCSNVSCVQCPAIDISQKKLSTCL